MVKRTQILGRRFAEINHSPLTYLIAAAMRYVRGL
jgi:hypothetical protein